MRPLKVYGWQDRRLEAEGWHKQTREIVAARSQAEAARLAGYTRPGQMFNLGETRNEQEIATATAQPGVVFWRGLDAYTEPWRAGQRRR